MTTSDISVRYYMLRWHVWNFITLATAALVGCHQLHADDRFTTDIQPLVKTHCLRCHSAEKAESGVRLDLLTPQPAERDLGLLKNMRRQIAAGAMPPEDEPPLTPAARQQLENWIDGFLLEAARRPPEKNGAMRRLTVAQYRNTLQDLLGLREDFTEVLPPDAPSATDSPTTNRFCHWPHSRLNPASISPDRHSMPASSMKPRNPSFSPFAWTSAVASTNSHVQIS
ncbi:MAG UNVERIFIED_CONTAM: DUF1587 domain-containing protein [Planctomycetaceae bacterium]